MTQINDKVSTSLTLSSGELEYEGEELEVVVNSNGVLLECVGISISIFSVTSDEEQDVPPLSSTSFQVMLHGLSDCAITFPNYEMRLGYEVIAKKCSMLPSPPQREKNEPNPEDEEVCNYPLKYLLQLQDGSQKVVQLQGDGSVTVTAFRKVEANFDFLLGQFTRFSLDASLVPSNEGDDDQEEEGEGESKEESKDVNVLAKGIEEVGRGVGIGLRGASKLVASGIKLSGGMVTGMTAKMKKEEELGNRKVSEEDIKKAENAENTSKKVHKGAQMVTGTIMCPIRMVGTKAGEMMVSTEEEEAPTGMKKTLLDTAGGIGNALTHITKAIDDSTHIIGQSVGDVAMDHSKAIHGEEYANQITSRKVKAASNVAKGFYHSYYALTIGMLGVAEAVLAEGVDMALSRMDYLVCLFFIPFY